VDASRTAGLDSICILTVVMSIRRGRTLVVVGIAAILLLALIFVVPALINVDRYRSQVISYLQEKTGKQVDIGRLALTLFPVTIHVDHIGIKNPPIFPAGYVVQVARINAELSVGALVHRQVVVKSLIAGAAATLQLPLSLTGAARRIKRAGIRNVKVAILLVDLKKLSLRTGELCQYLFIER
jgi:uncharacterized protein YhdP